MHFNVWNGFVLLIEPTSMCVKTADYCPRLPSWFKVHWHEVSYELLHIKWTELCTIICWEYNWSQKANTMQRPQNWLWLKSSSCVSKNEPIVTTRQKDIIDYSSVDFSEEKNTCLTWWFSKRVIIKSSFPNWGLIYLDVIQFSNQMVIKEENKPISVKWWNFNSVLWL